MILDYIDRAGLRIKGFINKDGEYTGFRYTWHRNRRLMEQMKFEDWREPAKTHRLFDKNGN